MDERPDPLAEAPPGDASIYSIERPHRSLVALYAIQSLAGLFVAPIIFIPLFCKYYTLRYRLDDEGISASWGILFRREIHLTYKRIQDIHVKRNLIERWLGIATVEVQTASGSSSAELSLEGMQDFEAVRDFLYRRMRGHAEADAGTMNSGRRSPAAAADTNELVALLNGIREDLDGTRRAIEERG